MHVVPFGSTGILVSQLCLGSMQFGWTADEEASFAVMDAFVAEGGNFIDTADIYSNWVRGHHGGDSERIIGKWLKARGNRDDLVLATKVRGRMWPGPIGEGLSRAHIIRACEDSLKRMQVETIDLYQCHWFDEATPIEETLSAFGELIRAGKVRYVGVSNFPPVRFREALAASAANALPGFISLQPHYSLVHRAEYEDELQGVCVQAGLAVIPYSPLAKGFLTGKYVKGGGKVESARANGVREYFTASGWATIDAVREIAAYREATCAAVALAWALAQPGITAPIVGANSPAQLAGQLPGTDLSLSEQELARLNEASTPP